MALHVFVIKETELEDPQDLRAEIGKCPISTNERKNMSTKTLRKRIALVAVSALGAGVLSVAPANAAALAANGIDITSVPAATPGLCSVDTDKEIAYALTSVAGVKVGLASAGDIEGYLSISGPAVFTTSTQEASAGSADTITFGADGKAVTFDTDNASDNLSFTVKPSAVGAVKITTRATSSTGTVTDVLTINFVASCANDTLSVADSFFAVIAKANAQDNTALASNADVSAQLVAENAQARYIALSLTDTYGGTLTSGAFVATVTSGDAFVNAGEAYVSGAANDIAAGKTKTAVLATTGKNIQVRVDQAIDDKPTVATIALTFNGVAIGSKTITFQGVAATIDVKDISVGKVGSVGVFRARVLDAAGNALYTKTVTNDSTANAALATSSITSGVTADAVSASDGDWSAATQGQFGCTKGGVATLNLKHTIDAATSVKKAITIACGDVLDTWTISLDKATYAPGEIATLTVAGKDSKGNAVNSTDTLGTLEYSFGGMTAVTAPTSADKFSSAAGAKRYTFSVGTSEGAFVGTFKITGATDTSAKTVQYKVAAPSTGAVSNADVLKAIVSLIASINKQIAALQKALLRR